MLSFGYSLANSRAALQKEEIETKNRRIADLEEQNKGLKQENSQLSSSKAANAELNGSSDSHMGGHSVGKEQGGRVGMRAEEHEQQVKVLSLEIEGLRKKVSDAEAERERMQQSRDREVEQVKSELGLQDKRRVELEAEASRMRAKAAELEELLSQSNKKLEEPLKSVKDAIQGSEEEAKIDEKSFSSPVHVNRVLLGAAGGGQKTAFNNPRKYVEPAGQNQQEQAKGQEQEQEQDQVNPAENGVTIGELEMAAVFSSPVAAVEHVDLEQLDASKDDALWCF